MKTKKIKVRQGFTIVELVIVIGVIGVLTAVLIPTFINLNKKAEEASNQSFVKNLNTQMAIREQEEGANKNMFEAIEDAKDIGFDVEKLTPVNGRDLVWDSVSNRFLLLNEDGSVYFGDKKATKDLDMWKVYSAMPSEQKYSIYAKSGWNTDVSGLKVGFDAGYNAGIGSVSYVGGASAQSVIIRTNGVSASLAVNAPNDTIVHYGNANVVNVTAVAKASYHENGAVSTLNVKEGRIEVAPEAYVGKMAIDKNATASQVIVENKGTVFSTDIIEYKENLEHVELTTEQKAEAASKDLVAAVGTTDSSDTLSIGNAEALLNLAAASNQGVIGSELNFQLSADIDLAGRSWVPFGLSHDKAFQGSIDGKNHKITGLKYTQNTLTQTYESASGFTGAPFGLIAYATKNVSIKNLTINADIDMQGNGQGVGAFIGAYKNTSAAKDATKYTLEFNGCTAKGSINAQRKVGGLLGVGFITPNATVGQYRLNLDTKFINCANEANIVAQASRAGGISSGVINVLNPNYKDGGVGSFVCTNCSNKGTVEAQSDYGPFAGYFSGGDSGTTFDLTSFTDSRSIGWDHYGSGSGIVVNHA
ncbi:MAG: type II secretion system protein [Bacilli bacterium]|nr:type II secretion system protein [Bacilli bacterium]